MGLLVNLKVHDWVAG